MRQTLPLLPTPREATPSLTTLWPLVRSQIYIYLPRLLTQPFFFENREIKPMSKSATKTKEQQLEDTLTEQNDDINKGTKKAGKKSTNGSTTSATDKKSSSSSTKVKPEKETSKAPVVSAAPEPDIASSPKTSQTKQAQAKPDTIQSFQIICPQEKLKEPLSVVKLATPSKPTHAVLGNVLIVTDEETQQVTLRVFDLSLGIETKFNAKVTNTGQFTLPVGLLTDIVSRFNRDSSINLNTTLGKEAHPTAIIKADTGYYQLNGMSAVEFPTFPSVESESDSTLNISVELLKEAIKRTSFAASNEETKLVLTGVNISASEDKIDFAATDGHRLSVVSTRCLNSAGAIATSFSFTCPSKSLVQLERMLSMLSSEENGNSNSPATVAISCSNNSNSFEFTFGKTRLVGEYLAGEYPNYPELMSQEFNHKVVLEKAVAVKALERISILADTDRKDRIIRIEFKDKQALLSIARNFGKGVETIPAYMEGNSIAIGFNLKSLLDGIKNTPSAEVQLELTTPTSPAIITAFGNRDNPTLTLETKYLIMPVEFAD